METDLHKVFKKLEDIECILLSKSPNAETDQLLTVKEASVLLHLSVPTLYGLCQNKLVPFCKKSKRLYFSKLDLTAWVKEGRRKTTLEIKAEVEATTPKKGRA